jgi:NADH-quinone oxidoreductase subunit E
MTKTGILGQYPPRMENVLLILHDLQNHNPRNYLSEKDLELVAAYLNTTLGVMYGIATYYTMFSLRPRGKHIIRICRSPVCHLAGVTDVLAELNRLLKIDIGETTTDQEFTLETTECLGQCDTAPAMMVDDMLYGNLTRNKIRSVIQRYGQPLCSAGKGKGLIWNEK